MNELAGFMLKELRHILRDKRTLTILLLLPLAQVLLFGFAVRTDIQSIRVAIVDPTPDASSISLRARLAGTEPFDIEHVVGSLARLDPLFVDHVERAAQAIEVVRRRRPGVVLKKFLGVGAG